jgi:hypothetical protein
MKLKNIFLLLLFLTTTTVHANKKISDLNSLAYTSWASGDLFTIVDISATETKKTTVSDLSSYAKSVCVADAITDGVTTVAPSENAVFDALALKTSYTANNHGVVVSGSGVAMTVIAPDASTSKVLVSGGASADPAWGLVSLTAGVSGVLPIANSVIATQAISSTAIDWSAGSVFTKTLGASTTFTFSNQTSGQTIVVRLTNTASNYTVTWPSVKWIGGSAPTMTIGATSDVYTFVYDGTNTYGSAVQDLH